MIYAPGNAKNVCEKMKSLNILGLPVEKGMNSNSLLTLFMRKCILLTLLPPNTLDT